MKMIFDTILKAMATIGGFILMPVTMLLGMVFGMSNPDPIAKTQFNGTLAEIKSHQLIKWIVGGTTIVILLACTLFGGMKLFGKKKRRKSSRRKSSYRTSRKRTKRSYRRR